MPYEYEKQDAAAGAENVADIYVVRGVEPRLEPSRELLAAVQSASAAEPLSVVQRSVFEKLVEVGFTALGKG